MNNDITPYSGLTDEELLMRVYTSKPMLSTLELELAARLEHALDELEEKRAGVGDVVTRRLIDAEEAD